MMKNKILKIAFVAIFGLGMGYSVYTSNQKVTLSDLSMNNIEALAQSGEASTSNCRPYDNWKCEALHPTDPSQDKTRDNAKW